MMSAIYLTAKTFFERLYLVLGLRKILPWVNCPYTRTTPTVHPTNISRFPRIFSPGWPLIFLVITIHQVHPETLSIIEPPRGYRELARLLSSQNSFWDAHGSFAEQWFFSVEFKHFRNFFVLDSFREILESDKLWEIQCWRVADGKDESW